MALTKDDRISGDLYAIATSAEDAQREIAEYLMNLSEDDEDSDQVFEELKDAMAAFCNLHNPLPTLRVYVAHMDIKPINSHA